MQYIMTENGVEKMTDEQVDAYRLTKLDLDGKKVYASCLINTNYTTYCEQGLRFTHLSTEYIIDNDSKTRDETDKKITNIALDVDCCFNWTMDNPRTKIDLTNKATTLVFLEAVQAVIASNEELLRDKKTEIDGMNQSQVEAYIASPTYPTYERTV